MVALIAGDAQLSNNTGCCAGRGRAVGAGIPPYRLHLAADYNGQRKRAYSQRTERGGKQFVLIAFHLWLLFSPLHISAVCSLMMYLTIMFVSSLISVVSFSSTALTCASTAFICVGR